MESLHCSRVYLAFPTHELVKDLTIKVYEGDIYSGEALRLLSLLSVGGSLFPLVRKLLFCFSPAALFESDKSDGLHRSDNDSMTSLMTETETNIGAFVQWVKNLVPNVSEVEVQPRNDGDQPSIESYPFSRLVVQLFQPVRHIEYTGLFDESGDHLPSALQLDGINDLVHIKCTFPPNADEFGQLAMQNALTL
ncbi:hypothetical protein GGH95_005626, partial [Coemansia sp. RSA 1836]